MRLKILNFYILIGLGSHSFLQARPYTKKPYAKKPPIRSGKRTPMRSLGTYFPLESVRQLGPYPLRDYSSRRARKEQRKVTYKELRSIFGLGVKCLILKFR